MRHLGQPPQQIRVRSVRRHGRAAEDGELERRALAERRARRDERRERRALAVTDEPHRLERVSSSIRQSVGE